MRDIPSPVIVPCRLCSKQEKNEIFNKDSPYYTANGRINLNGVERQVGV